MFMLHFIKLINFHSHRHFHANCPSSRSNSTTNLYKIMIIRLSHLLRVIRHLNHYLNFPHSSFNSNSHSKYHGHSKFIYHFRVFLLIIIIRYFSHRLFCCLYFSYFSHVLHLLYYYYYSYDYGYGSSFSYSFSSKNSINISTLHTSA
jgi:hypothetical protein